MVVAVQVHGQDPGYIYRVGDFALPAGIKTRNLPKQTSSFVLLTADTTLLYNGTIVRRLNARQAIVQADKRIPPAGYRAELVENGWKLDEGLREQISAGRYPTSLLVHTTNESLLLQSLPLLQAAQPILRHGTGFIQVQHATPGLIDLLINHPLVTYLQHHARKAAPELAVRRFDASANGVWLARNSWPLVNGAGITVSVKEDRFDTADIDYAPRSFVTSFASNNLSNHASTMATMIGGAGNSSLTGRGIAPACTLTSTSFANLLPEPAAWYRQYGVSIQNHSYGVGVESEYGVDGAAYDHSTWSDSTLLHVFSAGNAGTQSATAGQYRGLSGWANLTGSFKMSKNSIAVAATDSMNQVEARSSRGPAFDGRLKPELAAFGEDGTSGAAAIVSGAAALLQQQLRSQTGRLPQADLVKALLINSCTDNGEPGPDFVTGYGLLNIHRALQMATTNSFATGSVGVGQTWSATIQVQAGISHLAATLSWSDTAGAPGSFMSLQNDLDLEVKQPDGTTLLPWVLNSFPHPDSLRQPAVRKADTLNNVEQVSLLNPTPGTYTITIKPRRLVTQRQAFGLAWQATPANTFAFASPVSTRPVDASEGVIVRWQHSFGSGSRGNLFVENLSQGSAVNVVNTLLLDSSLMLWKPNASIGYTARLRMEVGAEVFYSDTFAVAATPKPQVGLQCSDSVLLYWSKVPGAQRYTVFNYYGIRLQAIRNTADTFLVYKIASPATDYFAVESVIGNTAGPRSLTFKSSLQGVECYIKSFYAVYNDGTALLSATLGTTYNVREVSFERRVNGTYSSIKVFLPQQTQPYEHTDANLVSGGNYYRLRIVLLDGSVILSDEIVVYHFAGNRFIVFPNPVPAGTMPTLLIDYTDEVTMELYDMRGVQLRRQKFQLFENSINTTGLPRGMYILLLRDSKAVLDRKKLIIQ
jgi:hypothetical protein